MRWIGIVAIVILLMVSCARTGMANPGDTSSSQLREANNHQTVAGQLGGTLIGLAPDDTATISLEKLDKSPMEWLQFGKAVPDGEPVQDLGVWGEAWLGQEINLSPGYYVVKPSSEGYVNVPGVWYFQVPEDGIHWRYRNLDFEFVRPDEAVARFGIPFCDERPEHGGIIHMPPGTSTPTPTFPPPGATRPPATPPPYPPGSCYAGQFDYLGRAFTGIQGRVSGLDEDAIATITIQELPPVSGEGYAFAGPPPADGSWKYPPDTQPLEAADLKELEPSGLVADIGAHNGEWGLIDPSLRDSRYLVTATGEGHQAKPPGYIVVVFGGRAMGLPRYVDFDFEAVP